MRVASLLTICLLTGCTSQHRHDSCLWMGHNCVLSNGLILGHVSEIYGNSGTWEGDLSLGGIELIYDSIDHVPDAFTCNGPWAFDTDAMKCLNDIANVLPK